MGGSHGLPFVASTVAPFGNEVSTLARHEAAVAAILSPTVFGDPLLGMAWIFGLLLVARFLPNTYEFTRRFKPTCNDYRDPTIETPAWLRWKPTPSWAVVLAGMLLLAVFQLAENTEFLYFQF